MARDRTPQEEVESILYAYGVKESGAIAEEICRILDPNNLRKEVNRVRAMRPYVIGFSDGQQQQGN